MFASAWLGIFYPELCFNGETCEAVYSEEDKTAGAGEATGTNKEADGIDAREVWRTSGDRLVVSSRFLEWCEERLLEGKE